MRYEVSKLEPGLLDIAVAVAADWRLCPSGEFWDVPQKINDGGPLSYVSYRARDWRPSLDWAQGGPIIQLGLMGLQWLGEDRGWFCGHCRSPGPGVADGYGPTPLIAAMRCLVAGKRGKEVELP